MTPTQLTSAIKRLGLTQAGLAAHLGVTTRAVEHWTAGTRPIPRMAELAIAYLEFTLPKKNPPAG